MALDFLCNGAINTPRDDLEAGPDVTYELNVPGIAAFRDVTRIAMASSSTDEFCLQEVQLILNGNENNGTTPDRGGVVYERFYGTTANTCRLVGGIHGALIVDHAELGGAPAVALADGRARDRDADVSLQSHSMTQRLPVDSSGLTPAWLSDALSPRYPGVRVAAVDVLDTTERTNHHLRLGLRYDVHAGAPDTLFCKLPPRDPEHRARIGASGMGTREVEFYAGVAPSLSMRMPACYVAAADADGSFLLLLEDLAAQGSLISDGSWAVPGKVARAAVAEMAELHVRFEDPARLATVATWATSRRSKPADFVIQTLRFVVDECRALVSEAYIDVAKLYIDHHEAIDAWWDSGPQTLIHGDAHIGNLFIDGDRVGFLDWGMAKIGTPMRDLSFFLTMGLDSEDRRRDERDLIQYYLDARHAIGGRPIAFDDAWLAHRMHAAYTVIASFLTMVPPYNTEARRMFTSNFRARAIAAIDELDAVAALRSVIV